MFTSDVEESYFLAKPCFWISLRDEEFELIKKDTVIKKEFQHVMFFKGKLIVIFGKSVDFSDYRHFSKYGDTAVIRLPDKTVNKLLKNKKSAMEFAIIPGTLLKLTTVDGFANYTYSRLVN